MVSNEIITNTRPYLSFQLGTELFATGVAKVLEILEVPRITKVPQSPAYMRGVINLRGSVLPVIDTRLKFGMPAISDTVHTCIIVLNLQLENEPLVLGALVDAVQEVLEISQEQIKSAPSLGTSYRAEFIEGIIKVQEDFIMLLDVEKVFTTEELISVKHTTEAEAESIN